MFSYAWEKINGGDGQSSGNSCFIDVDNLNTVENIKNAYYDNTELRSVLFALKSSRHAAAALTIGPGIYRDDYAPIRFIWEKIKEKF